MENLRPSVKFKDEETKKRVLKKLVEDGAKVTDLFKTACSEYLAGNLKVKK